MWTLALFCPFIMPVASISLGLLITRTSNSIPQNLGIALWVFSLAAGGYGLWRLPYRMVVRVIAIPVYLAIAAYLSLLAWVGPACAFFRECL